MARTQVTNHEGACLKRHGSCCYIRTAPAIKVAVRARPVLRKRGVFFISYKITINSANTYSVVVIDS